MQEKRYKPTIKIIAEASPFPEDTVELRRLRLYDIVNKNITSDFSAIECRDNIYLIFDYSNFYKVAKLEQTNRSELDSLCIRFWEAELNNEDNISMIRRLPVSRKITEDPSTSYFVTEIQHLNYDFKISFDFKYFNSSLVEDYWISFNALTPDYVNSIFNSLLNTRLFYIYCIKAGIISNNRIIDYLIQAFKIL